MFLKDVAVNQIDSNRSSAGYAGYVNSASRKGVIPGFDFFQNGRHNQHADRS